MSDEIKAIRPQGRRRLRLDLAPATLQLAARTSPGARGQLTHALPPNRVMASMTNSARGRIAVVQLLALAMMAEFSRVPAQYAHVVAGTPVQHTLAADETVTYVYDGRPEAARPDSGERYMLVEVRILVRASAAPKRFPVAHPVRGVAQLTYEADGDQYPDPLLMVAFEAVPFIFYAENQV